MDFNGFMGTMFFIKLFDSLGTQTPKLIYSWQLGVVAKGF